MNLRVEYLPKHWQEWVANHPKLSKGELTPEFNNCVHIHFIDDSFAFFEYAFAVEDEGHEDICVFTEHCGYYCFPLNAIEDYRIMKRIPYTLVEEKDSDGD